MKHETIVSLASLLALSGCSGYDRFFIATKTNVGLDVDSKPPTAEITIARRELAIQPTYPNYSKGNNANALPLLATFGLSGTLFTSHITGHFAGGDAAVNLVDNQATAAENPPKQGISPSNNTKESQKNDSSICLVGKPADMRTFFERGLIWFITLGADPESKEKIKNGNVPSPFYFATDSSFGLKVAWSGTTGPYPDTLKLGYNRKEFASAPVYVTPGCSTEKKPANITDKDEGNLYEIHSPSFLASIDNSSIAGSIYNSEIKHTQFFATGEAAKRFAKRPSIQQLAFSHMAPKAALEESNIPVLNHALYNDIKSSIKANGSNTEGVLAKAKELELVGKNTKPANLLDELEKKADDITAKVANDFIALRQYAKKP